MADAAPPSAAPQDVRRSILSLGAVNALDMVLQAALPMLLVRLLSDVDFGVYRALWLIVGTALAVLPMAMPTSLFYFLPRTQGAERGAFLAQAAVAMALTGVLGGLATAAWAGTLDLSAAHREPIAWFVGLWTFASLLDSLFNAMQRGATQAPVNLAFALLRFGAVAGIAWGTRAIEPVLIAHLVLAALKALTCVLVVGRQSRSLGAARAIGLARVREQWAYALPFGASAALYLLRARIDQWLVAAMFSTAQFGLYSVAAVFSPVQGLMRSTVNSVVLPELNRLQASDDTARMLALNRRGNVAMSLLMFPVLAFLFVAAAPLIGLLFTADYRGAAPVVRWYCLTLMCETIEVTTLMYAFRQGRYLMAWDALVLVVSASVCALGARWLGLPGAALGGLAGVLLAQAASLWRCARLTGTGVAGLQPWRTIGRIALAAIAAGGVAAGVLAAMADRPVWIGLFAAGLAFVVAEWVALRALGLAPVVRDVMGARLARWLGC